MENESVFIVGLPRTGSTLLRTQLNQSERVCITAETHFLHQWARMGRKKRLNRYGDLENDQNLTRLIEDLFSPERRPGKDFWSWLNNNISREGFFQRICQTDRSDRAFFELFMHIYAERMKGAVRPDLIIGEKTSANMYYVPTLLQWYPNARIIHTFRDPRGIFVSALKLVKAGKWGVKSRLSALPKPLVNPAIEVIMALYVSRAWLDASRLHPIYARQFPDQYMLLRFEDLIADPEFHFRNVCAFLNIPFEPALIENVNVIGSSYNPQRITQGGFEKNVTDRWKDHIHPWTRAWFSRIGKRQLESFGYNP